MVNPKHAPFTTTLDFIKENYGHYKLSFDSCQNGILVFLYESNIGYIRAEVLANDSMFPSPVIDFNTPNINWQYIGVHNYEDDNTTASYVSPNYKW
jgi:hypothetical protein